MTITLPVWLMAIGFIYTLSFPVMVGAAMWYVGRQQPDQKLVQSVIDGYSMAASNATLSADTMGESAAQNQQTLKQLTEMMCRLDRSDAVERSLTNAMSLIAHNQALSSGLNGRTVVDLTRSPVTDDPQTDLQEDEQVEPGEM